MKNKKNYDFDIKVLVCAELLCLAFNFLYSRDREQLLVEFKIAALRAV